MIAVADSLNPRVKVITPGNPHDLLKYQPGKAYGFHIHPITGLREKLK